MSKHWDQWTILGRGDLVKQQVNKLSQQSATEAKAAKAQADKEEEARKQEQEAKNAAFVEEAKRMKDWDLTGSWIVECNELATYSSGTPETLTMEIYRDEYRLDDVRDANGKSNEGCDEARYDLEPEEVEALQQADANTPMDQPHIPRYCATFNFEVVEGTMRIYPKESAKTKTATFKVSSSPVFEYTWRGRETGEGEIQTTADENVLPITFGKHGTTFEGSFQCEYLQPVKIIGRKIAHGRERVKNSKEQWRDLSQSAWERQCRRRWGGW